MTSTKTKKEKQNEDVVKIKRNRYGCMINLYRDGEVSIVLDLDKQINHYTKKQKLAMYDIVSKTFEDFILK